MIAYNKIWLTNLFIQQEADAALEQGCITKEESDRIKLVYPAQFYTPNFFIRIGLFILTKIVLSFSFGLLALLFISALQDAAGGLAVFFGTITCIGLEILVKRKKHFQSGVDDAMLWGAAIMLFCGISLPNNMSDLANCQIIFVISLLGTLRYADRIMAAVCFVSFLGMIFFTGADIGGVVKAILPFIIMTISLIVYFLVKRINDKKTFNAYGRCLTIIEIVSLLMLYIAGNYWVVRELSDSMFNLHLQPGQSIPFGFVFWVFTIVVPVVYLFFAVQKKDMILLRVSLLLIAATVFTVRYYHAILLPEVAMVIAGLVIFLLTWSLTRYLHIPKYGFTREELQAIHAFDKMQLESLILAQTFSQRQTNEGSQFGGGSFGGGGASGDY